MNNACLVLPHTSAHGAANMALDEAMLDAVADEPNQSFFRTYEWTTPTLSLGFFQGIREAEADPRWRSVPIVRRPTGGGAIWHHHELTYALALPAAHPSAKRGGTLYAAVHEAIAEVVRSAGANARRRGDGGRADALTRPFLCFTDRDREDLMIGVHKVVGSAQRRRRGAVLQHGAILLARSPATPELPGLSDVAAFPSDVAYLSSLLNVAVPKALGLSACFGDVPSVILSTASTLERSVYGDSRWTARR